MKKGSGMNDNCSPEDPRATGRYEVDRSNQEGFCDDPPHSDYASIPEFAPHRLGATAVLPRTIWSGDFRTGLPAEHPLRADGPPLVEIGSQESRDGFKKDIDMVERNFKLVW